MSKNINKIKLIQIMKPLIEHYRTGNLALEDYQQALENINDADFSNDLISYHEAKFLCFLFQRIPYYQIFQFLNNFSIELKRINIENNHKDGIIVLIQAYLSDLVPNITSRVSTEVTTHIYELVAFYYQFGYLDPKKVLPKLLKNSCNPEVLNSMEAAENVHYEQAALPGFTYQKEELRETISKSNYRKKCNTESNALKMIIRYLDEKSFEDFIAEFRKCAAIYKEKDKRDGEILEEEILMKLREFYKKALKAWAEKIENQKQEEEIQYRLHFPTNEKKS